MENSVRHTYSDSTLTQGLFPSTIPEVYTRVIVVIRSTKVSQGKWQDSLLLDLRAPNLFQSNTKREPNSTERVIYGPLFLGPQRSSLCDRWTWTVWCMEDRVIRILGLR